MVPSWASHVKPKICGKNYADCFKLSSNVPFPMGFTTLVRWIDVLELSTGT